MSKKNSPEVEITEFEKMELFVAKYYKSIIIGAVAIVVAVGIGVIVVDQMKKSDMSSMYAVSEANTVDALKKVIVSERGSKAVVAAQLKLAKLYLDKKEYDKVKQVYSDILNSDAINCTKSRVKLNLIALEETQGDVDGALAKYKALGEDLSLSEEVRAEANYETARLLISKNKTDEAKEILAQLAAKRTAWSSEADLMLKRL